MSAKQDRTLARTAEDLERRYKLSNTNRPFAASSGNYVTPNDVDKKADELRTEFDQKLEGFAKTEDLANFVEAEDLEAYALKSDLDGYATADDLSVYVKSEEYAAFKKAVQADVGAVASDLDRYAEELVGVSDVANGVASEVYDHLEFGDGGTRIKGSFNAMMLPAGTDLDGVILPNRYIGGNVAEYEYLNCPITAGAFFLCVEACGDQGQLLQRLTYGHKTSGKTFERVFDTDDWGEWIIVADYSGAAIEAIQNEVDALGIAFGEHMESFAASIAETDVDVGVVDDKVDALSQRTQTLERSVQTINVDLQGVITDINDHFDFVEGGTAIKGGLMPFILPAGTDLDGVTIPKKYVSGNVETGNYKNCPITSGTFSLEVELCGDQWQLLQRLTYSNKTNGKTYERVFYQDAWGAWVVVADYSGSALKAIQNEMDTLEADLSKHKTDSAARMTTAENNISTISKNVAAVSSDVQMVAADLQGVINDVNDHFDFNEGGMTIKGAINPMLIPARADLDSLLIPNKYIGGTITEYNYLNAPITSGTFSLEVEACGDQGQLKQRLTYSQKAKSKTYERFYYSSSWGEWVCVTDFALLDTSGKLLWNDGVYYMTATQTVNLPEAISAQKNGILLVFSEYANGAASDTAIHSFFVHKKEVELLPGKGYTFTLATSKLDYVATKNVFIYDTKIEGHADNNASGTGSSGVKYTNNRFALRYVLGF